MNLVDHLPEINAAAGEHVCALAGGCVFRGPLTVRVCRAHVVTGHAIPGVDALVMQLELVVTLVARGGLDDFALGHCTARRHEVVRQIHHRRVAAARLYADAVRQACVIRKIEQPAPGIPAGGRTNDVSDIGGKRVRVRAIAVVDERPGWERGSRTGICASHRRFARSLHHLSPGARRSRGR